MIPKDNLGVTDRIRELMGKPNIGAYYARENYRTHRLSDGAYCVMCGRPASEPHHVVPRSKAHGFTVDTPLGQFVVLTPLFALCRSCHNDFHGGARYEAEWVWHSEQYRDEWWSGHTLAHICRPQDPWLFQEGYYVIADKQTGEKRELRND